MNEANIFDIYSALIRRFDGAKVKIAEQEAARRDHEAKAS